LTLTHAYFIALAKLANSKSFFSSGDARSALFARLAATVFQHNSIARELTDHSECMCLVLENELKLVSCFDCVLFVLFSCFLFN
jgi:hypothetical protein